MNIITGTGRCGTLSAAYIFGGHHEKKPHLPWNKNLSLLEEHLKDVKEDDVLVASFYIPYLGELLKRGARVIYLYRDKEEVVDSFIRKTEKNGVNPWSPEAKNPFSKCFPKYNLPKEDAIRRYWELCYREAKKWKLKIYDVNDLNSAFKQREIFTYFNKNYPGFKSVRKNGLSLHIQQ